MYKNNSGRRPLLFKHILLWIIIYLDMSRIKMCNIICYCQYIMDNSSYKIRFYLYQKAMTLIWPICTTGGFLCPILTKWSIYMATSSNWPINSHTFVFVHLWSYLPICLFVATSDLWHISSQLVHLWPHHPTYLLWPHLTSYTYHPNLYIDDHIIPHTYYGHILPLAYIIPTCTFKDGPFNLQKGGAMFFF